MVLAKHIFSSLVFVLVVVVLVFGASEEKTLGQGNTVYAKIATLGKEHATYVDWCNDADLIAAASNKEIRIYDDQLTDLAVITREAWPSMLQIEWNRDCTLLAAYRNLGLENGGMVEIWQYDALTNDTSLLLTLPTTYSYQGGGPSGVFPIAWNLASDPLKPQIAIIDDDDTVDAEIRIWEIDVQQAEATSILQLSSNSILYERAGSIAWSPTGEHIAGVGVRGKLTIWDSTLGIITLQATIEGATDPIEWDPTGMKIAVTQFESEAFDTVILDAATATETQRLDRAGYYMDWGGNQLVISSSEVDIYDMTIGDLSASYMTTLDASVSWDGTGTQVASAEGNRVRIYDTVSETFIAENNQHGVLVNQFEWLSDFEIATPPVESLNVATIWDVNTLEQRQIELPEYFSSITWLDDNSFVTSLLYAETRFWEIEDDGVSNTLTVADYGGDLYWNPVADKLIVVSPLDYSLVVMNTSGEVLLELPDVIEQHVTWTTAGDFIIGRSRANARSLVILDSMSGETLHTIELASAINAIAWSSVEDVILVATEGGAVHVVGLGGSIIRTIEAGNVPLQYIAAHPTQPIFAVTSGFKSFESVEGFLNIYQLNGTLVSTIDAPTGEVFGQLAWNPSGLSLGVIESGRVTVWSEISQPNMPGNLTQDTSFTPTGTTAGFVLDDENPQDEGLEEDGFEVEWRGGWQGTFSDWMPYDTLPANPGTGSVAFELAQPIACEYGIIQVRVRAFYDTQPRLHSEWSNTAEVNLPCDDPTLPSPSNLVIDGANALPVVITWTDNASDEQGHRIERSVEGGAFAEIGTQSPNSTSYTDTTAVCGVNYAYRVRVERDGFVSIPSNEVSVNVGCE